MRNLCFPFKSKEVSWRTISPKKLSLYYPICVEFLKGDLTIDEYWHIFHMKGKIEVEDQVLKQKGWRGTAIQVDYQGNMIPFGERLRLLLPSSTHQDRATRTSKRLLRAVLQRLGLVGTAPTW